MRRLTLALITIFSAAALAACGDTGDHFGEFRQAIPPPTIVNHVTLAMPLYAGPNTKRADLKLFVTAYHGVHAVSQSTTLQTPIIIHSNWSGLKMLVGGKEVTAAAFGSAPATIQVKYKAPKNPCNPVVGFSAFTQTAIPQTVVLAAVQC